MEKYEIGQRIDIYKVLRTEHTYGRFELGQLAPEMPNSKHFIPKKYVYLYSWVGDDSIVMGTSPTSRYGHECRKVGTMIITKLK